MCYDESVLEMTVCCVFTSMVLLDRFLVCAYQYKCFWLCEPLVHLCIPICLFLFVVVTYLGKMI